MAAARLQRWAILLSAYSYEIEFQPTNDHSNADALSRLPLNVIRVESLAAESTLHNIAQLESLPVTVAKLQTHTRNDVILSKVCEFTVEGWSETQDSALSPYYHRKEELTVDSREWLSVMGEESCSPFKAQTKNCIAIIQESRK